jgi:hypothetical protein
MKWRSSSQSDGVAGAQPGPYINETVELLAAQAPKLPAALHEAKRTGMAYTIIDSPGCG